MIPPPLQDQSAAERGSARGPDAASSNAGLDRREGLDHFGRFTEELFGPWNGESFSRG
jgi:hypothetical protein